ncbi:MAG: zinc-binding dehydrogenase [Deltaproteobacteria bacterium]|nr:zinc-binding dehydrogenase [Deltaproteobacteria bacterium]
MRAVVMRDRKLVVDSVPDPVPGPGEALVRTLACGICGSDLHALDHADAMVEAAREAGSPFALDPERDLVMGHEFCVEVVDLGPATTSRLRPGDRAVSMPVLLRPPRIEPVGYSNDVPGGYGELMVLGAGFLLPVPNGLATEHAALTEPMAVGLHAVEMARLGKADVPLVVGCGPVGLAVITALRLRGAEPIVASDFSPARRRLATTMGAHVVNDPAETPAIEAFRAAAGLRPAVLFECVGVPGMIDRLMKDAPRAARIVVAGVCMEEDRIRPMIAINKELSLQFVLGYAPHEFAATLNAIADGRIDVAPLITDRVGLDDVPDAFERLRSPGDQAKILVEPWRR